MKVAFVHPDLGLGGAERLVVDAACGLQARGHSVTVYAGYHDPKRCFAETADGTLRVICPGFLKKMPRTVFGAFHAWIAILRMILLSCYVVLESKFNSAKDDSAAYDIVVVDVVSACIPVLKLFGRFKTVFYCHFPDLLLTKRTSLVKRLYRLPLDLLEEKTTAAADRLFVNSKFTEEVFRSTFRSLASVSIDVLYPACKLISDEEFKSPVDVKDLNAVGLKSASDYRIILSVNRYEEKKNIRLAVLAFCNLQKRVEKIVFDKSKLIVAGGYDTRVSENVKIFHDLCDLCKKEGISWTLFPDFSGKVVFLRSFSDDQKRFIFKICSAVVYTPRGEHFGIVPIEAMSYGKPVVAVNSAGPKESVVHGKTGYLCDDNPEEFSEAFAKLIEDSKLCESLGEAGRAHVKSKFTVEAFAEHLEASLSQTEFNPLSVQPLWILIFLPFLLLSALIFFTLSKKA